MFNFLSSLVRLMIVALLLVGVLVVLSTISPDGVSSWILDKLISIF